MARVVTVLKFSLTVGYARYGGKTSILDSVSVYRMTHNKLCIYTTVVWFNILVQNKQIFK